MADIGSFVGAVLWNWWTLLAGVMIAVEPVTRFLWRGYDAWAAKRLSPSRRRKLARATALGAFIVANYMAFHAAKEETRSIQGTGAETVRRLTPQQKTRLAAHLRMGQDEHFYVQFNSVQNCDECEDYAQEFREFFNTLRGWKADGDVVTFSAPEFRDGMHLVVSTDFVMALNERMLSAFDAADIPLQPSQSEPLSGGVNAIIVVGRRSK